MKKSEAVKLGLLKYISDKPCKRGHTPNLRYACGPCIQCLIENKRAMRKRGYKTPRNVRCSLMGSLYKALKRFPTNNPITKDQLYSLWVKQKGKCAITGLHIGDHDPSGLHMTENIRDRLATFTGVSVLVIRIALNIDQVHKYSMPPNPTKLSDSRAPGYVARYGYESWELDAFPPHDLQKLISENVSRVRDEKLWSEALAEEAEDKQRFDDMVRDLS